MGERKAVSWWIMPDTKKRLAKHGRYGESQDDLLNRLLDELEKKE